MSKRMISKIIISVFFISAVLSLAFAQGGFETVRNGFKNALKYDFEASDMLYEIGIDINDRVDEDNEHQVGNNGEVEVYCLPINGEPCEIMTNKKVYKCDLVLTVVAPTTGYISDIIQNADGYTVTVRNYQGYEITVNNIEQLYSGFGDEVSVGQIIGRLNKDGLAKVSVAKDGLYCNIDDFF